MSRLNSEGVLPFINVPSLYKDPVVDSRSLVTFKRCLSFCYTPVVKSIPLRKFKVTSYTQKGVRSFVVIPLFNQGDVTQSSQVVFRRGFTLRCCLVVNSRLSFIIYRLWWLLIDVCDLLHRQRSLRVRSYISVFLTLLSLFILYWFSLVVSMSLLGSS